MPKPPCTRTHPVSQAGSAFAHRQHHDFRRAGDFVKWDLPCDANRDDRFRLRRLLRGRSDRGDRRDRGLCVLKILACLATLEQEVNIGFDPSLGCGTQFDVKSRVSTRHLRQPIGRSQGIAGCAPAGHFS
ncbi:MAG: hypothetical protein NTW53_17875 [Burkholderiales bacterium]|nr:hypothetical protein [Burkholderiales bacterium]